MMKTLIFKALALGLLSLALISGPADAAGSANCPAFSAAMVDAAALVSDMDVGFPTGANSVDDLFVPQIKCTFVTENGIFLVEVGFIAGVATLTGFNDGFEQTFVRSEEDGLSKAEVLACRAQIIRSWVWSQHCAPFLP